MHSIKNIGTQIRLDEDFNLGGLGIHPHPQTTELVQLSQEQGDYSLTF